MNPHRRSQKILDVLKLPEAAEMMLPAKLGAFRAQKEKRARESSAAEEDVLRVRFRGRLTRVDGNRREAKTNANSRGPKRTRENAVGPERPMMNERKR